MSCIFLKVILTRHDDCYQGVDDRVHPNHQYSIQSEVLVHYPPVIGYSVSRSNFTSNHIVCTTFRNTNAGFSYTYLLNCLVNRFYSPCSQIQDPLAASNTPFWIQYCIIILSYVMLFMHYPVQAVFCCKNGIKYLKQRLFSINENNQKSYT